MLELEQDAEGRLWMRVERNGHTMMRKSPLGLVLSQGLRFTGGLTVTAVDGPREVQEQYEMPTGKQRLHQVDAVQLSVTSFG